MDIRNATAKKSHPPPSHDIFSNSYPLASGISSQNINTILEDINLNIEYETSISNHTSSKSNSDYHSALIISDDLKKKYMAIYTMYIADGAENEVNIPERLKLPLQEMAKNNTWTKHCFDDANNHIKMLMVCYI